MALSEERKEYLYEYQKNKLKRIPLDVPKEKYDSIKAAAQNVGESVNGYIKKAIDERMERDSSGHSPTISDSQVQDSVPQTEPQPVPKETGLPSYLTPDILARIDRAKFAHDTAYQIEIGNIIGMSHLADLADYLKQ